MDGGAQLPQRPVLFFDLWPPDIVQSDTSSFQPQFGIFPRKVDRGYYSVECVTIVVERSSVEDSLLKIPLHFHTAFSHSPTLKVTNDRSIRILGGAQGPVPRTSHHSAHAPRSVEDSLLKIPFEDSLLKIPRERELKRCRIRVLETLVSFGERSVRSIDARSQFGERSVWNVSRGKN